MTKGEVMNIKVDINTLRQAIKQGCKTVSDLARYIKVESAFYSTPILIKQ